MSIGPIYKREEDGIVLIDQDKCRGWRMCVSACPYKKIYYNWKSGKAEKCIFCYPRIEVGQPTVCSETCVGRIRYLGVLLYDADRIEAAASVEHDRDLYQAQLDVFLDPNDPKVIEQARADGISPKPGWKAPATARCTRWRWTGRWRCRCTRNIARCRWCGTCHPVADHRRRQRRPDRCQRLIPDVKELRIPVNYLANLLTAGDTKPVVRALERMLAMRAYQRDKHVDQVENLEVLERTGLSVAQVEEMYRIMAIANYEDRFVIPSTHREYAENTFDLRGGCGFSFGNGCSDGISDTSLFGAPKAHHPDQGGGLRWQQEIFQLACVRCRICSPIRTANCALIWTSCNRCCMANTRPRLRLAALDALVATPAGRRSARLRGGMLTCSTAAAQPRCTFRACAWRFTRSRNGDGRPG